MSTERTVYASLSDEEIDKRADFKVDVSSSSWFKFAAYRKVHFWFLSWWSVEFESDDLERCIEYLQTVIQLPRRYTRKVVPRP